MKEIDVTTLSTKLKEGSMKVLDVRTPGEFEAGHLDAIHIPLQELPQRVEELSSLQGTSFAVVCRSGGRSSSAVQWLHANGFDGATNVRGGMQAWKMIVDPNMNVA